MDEDMAIMCKALGDPTRLRIFQFLKSCCCAVAVGESGDVHRPDGPSVGDVCCHVLGEDRVNSRVSFHLKELRQAGLITMKRQGKYLLCQVNQDAINRLAAALVSGLPTANGSIHTGGNHE